MVINFIVARYLEYKDFFILQMLFEKGLRGAIGWRDCGAYTKRK